MKFHRFFIVSLIVLLSFQALAQNENSSDEKQDHRIDLALRTLDKISLMTKKKIALGSAVVGSGMIPLGVAYAWMRHDNYAEMVRNGNAQLADLISMFNSNMWDHVQTSDVAARLYAESTLQNSTYFSDLYQQMYDFMFSDSAIPKDPTQAGLTMFENTSEIAPKIQLMKNMLTRENQLIEQLGPTTIEYINQLSKFHMVSKEVRQEYFNLYLGPYRSLNRLKSRIGLLKNLKNIAFKNRIEIKQGASNSATNLLKTFDELRESLRLSKDGYSAGANPLDSWVSQRSNQSKIRKAMKRSLTSDENYFVESKYFELFRVGKNIKFTEEEAIRFSTQWKIAGGALVVLGSIIVIVSELYLSKPYPDGTSLLESDPSNWDRADVINDLESNETSLQNVLSFAKALGVHS